MGSPIYWLFQCLAIVCLLIGFYITLKSAHASALVFLGLAFILTWTGYGLLAQQRSGDATVTQYECVLDVQNNVWNCNPPVEK